MTKPEPWYIHAILYAIIAVLVFILIKVAIIDPTEVIEAEKINRTESRLRLKNLREAEILWYKKNGYYTSNIDSLVGFVKESPFVDSIRQAYDSLTRRPADPFMDLTSGQFTPESLLYSPKSHQKYIVEIDSSMKTDTVVNQRGKIIRVDTLNLVGTMYSIDDPDGYGSIGSTTNEALKNSLSWE